MWIELELSFLERNLTGSGTSKNSQVCLWWGRMIATSFKGKQGVKLALVSLPYQVKGILRPLHTLLKVNPQVFNSCMVSIWDAAEGFRVSIGDWWNKSYDNNPAGSLQCDYVEDFTNLQLCQADNHVSWSQLGKVRYDLTKRRWKYGPTPVWQSMLAFGTNPTSDMKPANIKAMSW